MDVRCRVLKIKEMPHNSNFFQNRSLLENPFDTIVTPTYDLSNYGKDLFIPLNDAGTNTTTFTNSSATILRNELDLLGGTDNGVEVDDYPSVIANEDTLVMWDAGDDTQFSRTYRYSPDAQAIISKIYLNIAFAANQSAWTSGGITFSSVDVTVTERANDSGEGDRQLFTQRYLTGHGELGAIGTDIFILSAVIGDLTVKKNLPLDFLFTMNVAKSMTNTRQEGIVPFFSWNPVSAVKPYSLSGYGMHVMTSFDNAQIVLRQDTKGYTQNIFGTSREKV